MTPFIKDILLALGISFGVVVILGPFMIPLLAHLKAKQSIREDGPLSHLKKSGTPTMGGIMILIASCAAVIILTPTDMYVWVALAVMLAVGLIGFWDDYIKVLKKQSLGLRAIQKIGLQVLVGLVFVIILTQGLDKPTSIYIPFVQSPLTLGWLYYPFVVLVLLAAANAVNLTDGLDGLAAGVTVFAAMAMGCLAYIHMQTGLTVFAFALAGACLGFLVFNRHPAKVFMGDTGSMALGGALTAVAVMTGTEFYFLIIGGVYVVETLSVILQVASFHLTGRRIFRMSPLHHHYELSGWKEMKVVHFFYLWAFIFAVLGILVFKLTELI